ncbi:MAG: methyltransferase domain-containing protein [Proteobacteria bacterium]|jgi:phosphatidylethanolamine/phosphatidyl-N-methylethanolamine N-methyltransferase|nr:methyltransferase domain-containing protein [Pseudomonadota bacterium]
MKSHVAVETSPAAEGLLFLRRWFANPLKVGAVLPSSPRLAKLVARQVRLGPDEAVVELGAGTGAVTKALLKAGIPANRLFVIEIDAAMCGFLRKQLPQVQVIQGDASRLPELIPAEWHSKIPVVISGIPMVTLPMEVQRRLYGACFDVLAPGGRVLQYTYSLVSPIPERRLGLKGRRKGVTLLNVPPAWVWAYEQAA